MSRERIDALFDRNDDPSTATRGILGVDWTHKQNLSGLEAFAALVAALPSHVHRLECSLCLGRSQESTPINIYRRLRMRLRQIETILISSFAQLEELQIRFYVTTTLQGREAVVEIMHVSPHVNRGFPARVQHLMLRNQLLHGAQALAEPPLPRSATVTPQQQDEEEEEQELVAVHKMSPSERHAVWGRAITSLVERRDRKLTTSSIYVLIQKNANYLPC